MDEHINNINIAVNSIIQYRVDAGSLSNTNANTLREALIHIRDDTKFLNAIIKYYESFMALHTRWISNAYPMDENVNNIKNCC